MDRGHIQCPLSGCSILHCPLSDWQNSKCVHLLSRLSRGTGGFAPVCILETMEKDTLCESNGSRSC